MKRVFDYGEARNLCVTHRELLLTIQKTIAARNKDADKLKKDASEVLKSKVIASEIITALQTGNVNFQLQPNELSLMHSVYVYDEGRKLVAVLEEQGKARTDILRDMKSVQRVGSGFRWFFSRKKTKQEGNEAYQRLAQLIADGYQDTVNKQKERGEKLDTITTNKAFGRISGKESAYVHNLYECVPDLIGKDKLPPETAEKIRQVKEVSERYRDAKKGQDERETKAKAKVLETIAPLIMAQTMQKLREQDVEVLLQKRSGLRVKALRENGYQTIADVYAASEHSLASLYGVSADAAKLMKAAAAEIAQDVSKTIKLSISSDNRTEEATALLKSVFVFDKVRKQGGSVTEVIQSRMEDAVSQTDLLAGLKNNLCWVLTTTEQKQQYAQAYESVQACLMPSVLRAVDQYCEKKPVVKAPAEDEVWDDFAQRSVEYYNILEELCPEVFGNDDLIYGLPEELAREIQDEIFFPDGLKVTLRRYQEWGVKYILHQGRVLLGDEMGLGKTIQAIATMVSLRNTGAKKFLVVCPASVLPNWCNEIEKKSEFHATKIHGYGRQEAFDSWKSKGGVAVTTYDTLGVLKTTAQLQLDLLVVDEAHFIKNENAQRSQAVRRYGTYTKRILYMTGTALENKVEEMISLIQVLNPDVAQEAQRLAFMSTAPQFREVVAPVYYRRKREDVLTELPEKEVVPEWCELLPEEREAYERAVLAKNRTAIRRVSWMSEDPYQSSKARRLLELVEEAEGEGRKVLVFSFYLETIEKVVRILGNRCTQPINGSVPAYRRQEIIDEFENMPAGSVLPAQIVAGGTGLNIQTASMVIICEPQLKPSLENQAISRVHRMGQTRKVLVYRLLAGDTVDERLDDLLTKKQEIFDAFADKSEAAKKTAQEEQQIDDKTFGKLIQEEIDRINEKKGKE